MDFTINTNEYLDQLYETAIYETDIFEIKEAFLGTGMLEDYYGSAEEALAALQDLIDEFEEATGLRFYGSAENETVPPEEIMPDPDLPQEEYEAALKKFLFAAYTGTETAADWELNFPDGDAYDFRMTYI